MSGGSSLITLLILASPAVPVGRGIRLVRALRALVSEPISKAMEVNCGLPAIEASSEEPASSIAAD